MKYLIILFFLLIPELFAQDNVIRGTVTDSETGQPLLNANVQVWESSKGTSTNSDGKFTLSLESTSNTIVISHLGYRTQTRRVEGISELNIRLEPSPISSQTVLVEAAIGTEGVTPGAFTKVRKEEIESRYSVKDIPEFLSHLPSTTFYSESGNGIGYNYLSIRGFDQRRITVSINGIPQNDPEDHNVYWLDFPDLLESTSLIQVQRGAGAGVFGYPSIGGTINIITSGFTAKPAVKLNTSYGSYHTRKFSASFSSGLIDDKYSFYGSLSQIKSSGYRENSWVNFNAYHLSAVRYDEKLTSQLNFFGGPISDGLVYTGLPKFAVKDKALRRANYSYWEADHSGYTYTMQRRPEEKENFSQPHFELLNEYKFNNNVNFNSALFLIQGNGFFDYDASWADTSYFRITGEHGFNPAGNPENAIIRAMVENTQYGWIPRISLRHQNGELIAGTEFRRHRSLHWGSINFASNLPGDLPEGYRYYSYRGGKDIINGFIHERYNLNNRIDLIGELQLAYHKYKLFEEEFLNNDFTVDGLFFNPKAALNYKVNERHNIFFSFARVTREPRLKNYYDAAESSGGEVPLFEVRENGIYDFNNPLVKPETMNDFELGSSISSSRFNISLNLYYMLFNDEIVRSGKLDRFGQPVTGNMDKTVHTGVETSVRLNVNDNVEVFANATYSRNTIEKGTYFIDENNSIDLKGNRISGFPDFLFNSGISLKYGGASLRITGKYSGSFFTDNYDNNLSDYLALYPDFADYTDNKNDAYFTADLYGSYEIYLLNDNTPSRLYFQVFNLTNNLYSAYGIGKEFFPAAERNFIFGLQLGL